MENEDGVSAPSTPVTPGTPGAPLFGGFRPERDGNGRKSSLLKSCRCFSVEAWTLEEGSLPSVSCALPPPPVSLARKVGAEFIGTLILIFAGTATAIVNQKTQGSETLLGLAASTGLAVMIVILSTGHISGAHLNPSITLAFAALKHFPFVLCICRETTGASMNPVRTLGPAIAADNYKGIWIYLTAPILGALAGAGVYSAVKLPDDDDKAHERPLAAHSFRR